MDAFTRIMNGEDLEKVTMEEISRRKNLGNTLAEKFPELKGLSWVEFLEKNPIDCDFITAHEMWEALK